MTDDTHSSQKIERVPLNHQLITEQIQESQRLCDHFEQRKTRAIARIPQYPLKQWNFAIIGIQTESDCFSFSDIGELRRVFEPPGEVELAGALNQGHLFSAIGRYSHSVTHELAINFEIGDQKVFDFAWWIISALRVKTLAEFLVPAAANHSWSVIAGLENRTCEARLVEDVPQARWLERPVLVQESDLTWVQANIITFIKLLDAPKFRLAVDALCTHQHLLSHRMMIASLWSGIEALIGIQAELRFRLALSVASLLEPRGAARIELYRQVKKLYDVRSRAVHGVAMKKEELAAHVAVVRRLLSRMLCTMIEGGNVLSEEEIEARLLN